ncbi:MAG: helix-turn-helix domain-containing protein [Deltaproteobacteria bacterium]|nr:helix-turn-helix domain-containing protein [Deltaproteobacteria bacterium]
MNNVLSVREVARYLKLNEQTVYRLAREGKLPASKIGKQWRFSRRDIEALIQKHRSKGAAKGGE